MTYKRSEKESHWISHGKTIVHSLVLDHSNSSGYFGLSNTTKINSANNARVQRTATSTNHTEIQTSTVSPDVAETQPKTPSTTLIETGTKITAEDIPGTWVGKATWECPLDDPIWSATVEFRRDGSFAAIMSAPTLEEQVGSGVWSLFENDIEISFPTTIWAGTVTNGKMAGTLSSPEVDDCMGIWSLVKE